MAAPDAKFPTGEGERPAQDGFEKLERLVRSLVERYESLRVEHSALKEKLREREDRLHGLDERVLELNQLRQDTAKRIDDLIAQIDRLDSTLEKGSHAADAE